MAYKPPEHPVHERIMQTTYDTIGVNYSDLRRPDARIAAVIEHVLGPARTVLNVGAGAGSYEPAGREITAVEPSAEMIRQRRTPAVRIVQGSAEDLPFDDKSFDAAMAVNTAHHWSDKAKGFGEIRRVTRGPVVILAFDPAFRDAWLMDYFPGLVTLDDGQMPKLTDYTAWLGDVEISSIPVPHDCTDGFLYAYWRRPAAYLDPRIRAAMSSFWLIEGIDAGLKRLADDLESGVWARAHGYLFDLDACDVGYRLILAR